MARNPILEEIYAARDMLLADYNGDVHAYVVDARRRAMASGRPIAVPERRADHGPTADPCVPEVHGHPFTRAER